MKMNRSCLLCGVGGQGVVLASRLIACAAMKQGKSVRTAETIGMAQRGGSVVSHVRIGEEIYSPLIEEGTADVLIAFEPGEAVRCLPYLKKGGTVITNSRIVKPVTSSLGGADYSSDEMLSYLEKKCEKLIIVDGEKLCAQAGSDKVLNTVLLGAAAGSGSIGITLDELIAAVGKNVKEKFIGLNEKALRLGNEAGGHEK